MFAYCVHNKKYKHVFMCVHKSSYTAYVVKKYIAGTTDYLNCINEAQGGK